MAIAVNSATTLLHVYDVPISLAFYRDILGFEVASTSPPFTSAKDDFGWTLLRLNGIELMLNNAYENNVRPPYPEIDRVRAHADTTLYLDCLDLDTVCLHLHAHGIDTPKPKVSYYGMRQVYITDPDGYGICFQSPADAPVH